jgi:hypothetical protein
MCPFADSLQHDTQFLDCNRSKATVNICQFLKKSLVYGPGQMGFDIQSMPVLEMSLFEASILVDPVATKWLMCCLRKRTILSLSLKEAFLYNNINGRSVSRIFCSVK